MNRNKHIGLTCATCAVLNALCISLRCFSRSFFEPSTCHTRPSDVIRQGVYSMKTNWTRLFARNKSTLNHIRSFLFDSVICLTRQTVARFVFTRSFESSLRPVPFSRSQRESVAFPLCLDKYFTQIIIIIIIIMIFFFIFASVGLIPSSQSNLTLVSISNSKPSAREVERWFTAVCFISSASTGSSSLSESSHTIRIQNQAKSWFKNSLLTELSIIFQFNQTIPIWFFAVEIWTKEANKMNSPSIRKLI